MNECILNINLLLDFLKNACVYTCMVYWNMYVSVYKNISTFCVI